MIRLTSGELLINKNLTITGGGVIIDANNASRVIRVASGATVSMSGMTLTGGNRDTGGGIYNQGTLTLTNMTITGNTATQVGGGISAASGSSLTLVNSTVSDNTSTLEGGGIFTAGSLTVTGSTISGNTSTQGGAGGIFAAANTIITNSAIIGNSAVAGGGGGIWTQNDVSITNTTISGNRSGSGGGIFFEGSLTLTNVTIANNNAAGYGGGGIYRAGGVFEVIAMRNSIVAGNSASVVAPDISGAFTSQGNNLVQNRAGSSGYIASDLPDGTNPLLGPLANNGGLSATHALLVGSPAINAGNNSFTTGATDQRGTGYARVVSGAVDIGAFEALAPSAALVSVSGRVTTEYGRSVSRAQVWMTNSTGGQCFASTNTFGFYRIEGVPAGETYIFDVRHIRFSFLPHVLTIMEDKSDLNFTAQPKK
jgi:hypothetical protein